MTPEAIIMFGALGLVSIGALIYYFVDNSKSTETDTTPHNI